MAISTCTPVWLQSMQEGYQQDPKTQQMLTALLVKPDAIPHFTLEAVHSSTGGGHSGFPVTYRKMKQLFAWQGMKTITKAFVQSCTTCQQAKPIRTKYPGLLSPLPVPKGAWHTISLDFIEGLPTSEKANCILVTVDKFYKYAHFVPLHHPFTAAVVAQ
jgi:hypothetical protein